MKRVRSIVQILLAIALAGGFAFCLVAACAGDSSRRGGAILLRAR